jgi:hypothetical protein
MGNKITKPIYDIAGRFALPKTNGVAFDVANITKLKGKEAFEARWMRSYVRMRSLQLEAVGLHGSMVGASGGFFAASALTSVYFFQVMDEIINTHELTISYFGLDGSFGGACAAIACFAFRDSCRFRRDMETAIRLYENHVDINEMFQMKNDDISVLGSGFLVDEYAIALSDIHKDLLVRDTGLAYRSARIFSSQDEYHQFEKDFFSEMEKRK